MSHMGGSIRSCAVFTDAPLLSYKEKLDRKISVGRRS